jgi:hypothetical protein
LPKKIEGICSFCAAISGALIHDVQEQNEVYFSVPTTIPAGRVLIHNLISHNRNTVPGTHGFRAWFDALHHDYVICSCGWAPHLGPHYCETAVEEEKVN